MPIISRNPYTEEILLEATELTTNQVQQEIGKAKNAFDSWKKTSFNERAKLVRALGLVLRENRVAFAELIALEMGMPVSQAAGDIEKTAQIAEYYADNAEEFLKPEFIEANNLNQYISYEPMGMLLQIAPWNYPFYLALRPIIPALMAGNVALLKHASNVPQIAKAIAGIFQMTGFPQGVCTVLMIGSSMVKPIIEDARINIVTLIGSEFAGSKVAATAGAALKKTIMELGGNDPFIALKDANVAEAGKQATTARLRNQGQSCNAAKRFIVEEEIAEEFLALIKQNFEAEVYGDPLEPKTTFGPLATKEALDTVTDQVQRSLELGAKIITGGHGPDAVLTESWKAFRASHDKGYFYPPTILTNVTKEMPVYKEEVFGPVVPLIVVQSVGEAVAVANDSSLGLGASLWTKDLELAKKIIPQLECGMVCVNSMVRSNIKMPFGGVKKSGYGRELGVHGLKEFVNVKSVVIS
jgi:succinate-semialdehyde dehydrogenase / glutarate-semialdehyde dehydrogenase